MRHRAKRSWLAAVLVASYPNQAIGQGDLGVAVLGTTATQAILSYTAPTGAPCIVEASGPPEYWQPLRDLDLPIIEGTNSDDSGGRKRTILIGMPLTEVGRGNTAYSRALQPDTLYFFRITCGQAVGTGAFRTAPLTNGITYSDAAPPSQPSPSPGTPAITDSLAHRPPPVPSPRRPWRPRRHLGNSCVSNGTGGGAWNSPATWTGCAAGVPGNEDTATLSNGDTVTVPAGYHAIVGASGTDAWTHGTTIPALACRADNGNGILIIYGTLTFRGHIAQCSAQWVAYQGAIIEHDSSLASTPSTTHYRWMIGMQFRPSGRMLIRGQPGNRVIVRNAARSGAFYGFTYDGSGSAQGSGQYDFEYVTIDGCGGTTPCAYGVGYGASVFRLDHGLVTNSGMFRCDEQGSGPTTCGVTNSSFTASANINHTVIFTNPVSGPTLIDTIYTDGQIWLGGATKGNYPNYKLRNVVSRNIINKSAYYPITMGGAQFRMGEFDLYLRITDPAIGGSGSQGVWAYLPGGNVTRTMCIIWGVYPHCFSGPGGDGTNPDVIDGGYLEKHNGGTAGHGYLGPSGSTATLTTIKNVVVACATDTGYGVSLSSNAISAAYLKTFSLVNNTYCGKYTANDGTSRGFGFELAYTAPAGMLQGLRNNIVFSNTPADAAYIVHDGATGTPGTGTFANVDYNWKWNVGTVPYQFAPNAYYSPNPPGAHDSSGDPQFVQQRHFLDWGQMLKPSIASWSDIVAEFAKMNDDTGYDSRFTLANAYNWLRDGYRPQNPAVMTAGDTGGRVGAMDAVPQQ